MWFCLSTRCAGGTHVADEGSGCSDQSPLYERHSLTVMIGKMSELPKR